MKNQKIIRILVAVAALLVVVGILAACGEGSPGAVALGSATSTPIVVRETAIPATVAPTEKPAPTLEPTNAPTAVPPTAEPTDAPTEAPTKTPEPTAAPQSGNVSGPAASCLHGEVLWADGTDYSGYGLSPVGGLEESRWIVGETWRANPATGAVLESYVFLIPPHQVAWLVNYTGGTAWGLCVATEQAAIDIATASENGNVANVTRRDGIEPKFVVLPRDAAQFGLLHHIQVDPVKQIQGPAANVQPTAPVVVQPTAPVTVAPRPAQSQVAVAGKCNTSDAVGPAILEFGDPSNGKATVLKLNAGSTSPKNNGGCYSFESQAALNARWPAHKAEFLGKNASGQALEK